MVGMAAWILRNFVSSNDARLTGQPESIRGSSPRGTFFIDLQETTNETMSQVKPIPKNQDEQENRGNLMLWTALLMKHIASTN
jgi:hypothetical protein